MFGLAHDYHGNRPLLWFLRKSGHFEQIIIGEMLRPPVSNLKICQAKDRLLILAKFKKGFLKKNFVDISYCHTFEEILQLRIKFHNRICYV